MILDDIETALKSVYPRVFYGTAAKIARNEPWNYIVFGREAADLSPNLTSLTTTYVVAYVHEDYTPEDAEERIISAMCAIPGVKPSGEGAIYEYQTKPGTTDVVEMLAIRFKCARKIDVSR